MIDSSPIRVHQHAGNAQKEWPIPLRRSRGMGRSVGGLTTKIHAMVDAQGRPINLVLSEGQAYDGHSAHLMRDSLTPGSILLADRAYDANKLRTAIADKGAFANISPMPQRGRRSAFSPFP